MANNENWRNLTPDEVKASFGNEGYNAFAALIAANKIAGDCRKALHSVVSDKLGAMPAGKVLIAKAQYGKLSLGIVDGETKSAAKPKASLGDWLASQSA